LLAYGSFDTVVLCFTCASVSVFLCENKKAKLERDQELNKRWSQERSFLEELSMKRQERKEVEKLRVVAEQLVREEEAAEQTLLVNPNGECCLLLLLFICV
jgi:hypothetical protein